MLVTLSGMTRLSKDSAILNAQSPMLVRLFERTRLFKEKQYSYQLFVDYQCFTFKKVEKWIYWFNLHS